MKIKVEGKFPGMNEIIAASKKHYSAYSKMKKENTELFQWATKKMPKFEGKVSVRFHWYFKNKRRDPDNIMAAQKFILDALVKNEIIKDDNVSYISSIDHTFTHCDKDAVQIEVLPSDSQS